ncbi:MAG: thioredoxin family protein [Bacteroidetes bacterium]|nr:thioredoxin family protein [Bacteroidota bacterium]
MLLSCAPLSYTIETEVTGTKVLKGVFDREVLEENPDFSWFTTNYSAYRYDSAVVNRLAPLMNDVHVVMIVGTWCGDSKRELPKQFKIFDALQLSNDKIVVFGVDRSKKSVDGTTQKYRVVKVPTLIVFRGEQELGRIVENPTTSQEEDLLRLLKK